MISYELAKKLKDAGFPQEGKLYQLSDGRQGVAIGGGICMFDTTEILTEHDGVLLPSLSELVEACGEHFHELKRIVNDEGIIWRANGKAVPNGPDWGYSIFHFEMFNDLVDLSNGDKTPSEAVANLWLELNK